MQSIAGWELTTLSIPQIIYLIFLCVHPKQVDTDTPILHLLQTQLFAEGSGEVKGGGPKFLPSDHFVEEPEERVAAASWAPGRRGVAIAVLLAH